MTGMCHRGWPRVQGREAGGWWVHVELRATSRPTCRDAMGGQLPVRPRTQPAGIRLVSGPAMAGHATAASAGWHEVPTGDSDVTVEEALTRVATRGHPAVNYHPRLAALRLAPPTDACWHVSGGALLLISPSLADAYISLAFHDPDAAGAAVDLALPPWVAAPDFPRRIVWAATPDVARHAVERVMSATGRVLIHREPCRTWAVTREAWAALTGDAGDVVSHPVLDLRTLGADLSPPGDGGRYECDVLRQADAPVVNGCWTYNAGLVSEARIRDAIANDITACIRWVPPAAGGAGRGPEGMAPGRRLVSWIVVRPDGSLGILHTLPACRGAGLAACVVRLAATLQRRWISKLQAGVPVESARYGDVTPGVELDTITQVEATASPGLPAMPRHPIRSHPPTALLDALRPHCHIKVGNVASEKLFTRLGFTIQNEVSWLIFDDRAKPS